MRVFVGLVVLAVLGRVAGVFLAGPDPDRCRTPKGWRE